MIENKAAYSDTTTKMAFSLPAVVNRSSNTGCGGLNVTDISSSVEVMDNQFEYLH